MSWLTNSLWLSLKPGYLKREAQRRQEAEALRDIAAALNSTLNLDEVLDRVLDNVGHVVPHDSANIMRFEDGVARIVRHRPYAERPYTADWRTQRFIVADMPILHRMIEYGQSFVIPDVQTYPDWIDMPETKWVRSYAGMPIRLADTVIGCLNLISATSGFFTPIRTEPLQAIADHVAVALDNARLHKDLQDRMQALQTTQAQLIHSEKMAALGRLVASIAHEINNPLQAVQTCLTLTTEELADEQRREKLDRYLGIVDNEIERISTIVQRMRDFYRPASQEFQLIDLHTVLESVLTLAGKQLQHSNIIVERAWVTDLPKIQANADHLKQVFLNMVLNAIDAMPQGGTLQVSTVSELLPAGSNQQPSPGVRLMFSDTGDGMSPETQDHIFEPFFTTKDGGSGLGLAISYGIIEAHQGLITVESERGLGTTFTILLPVDQ